MFKIHLNKNIYVKNINSYSQNIFNFMGILIFKALKKLIMKKIYSFFSVLFITAAMTAQVNVTYMVDITDYLAAGNVLGAGGIRIGGDFAATGGMNGAAAMAAWAPADPTCALTDMGGNVWGIVVTYPDASIGLDQPYKFVNNDWGTNEGTDAANTIGADGCGTDDGAGNVNRHLLIPDADIMLQYCWDRCFKCDGSDPIVLGIFDTPTSLGAVTVSPNPVSSPIRLKMLIVTSLAFCNVKLKLTFEETGFGETVTAPKLVGVSKIPRTIGSDPSHLKQLSQQYCNIRSASGISK